MRFWWPDWEPRERSLSDDSECSTASHSSLASDASFYDASSDAETGLAGDPETAVSTGMGAETAVHDPSTVESGSDQVLGTDWSERQSVIFTPLCPRFRRRTAPEWRRARCNNFATTHPPTLQFQARARNTPRLLHAKRHRALRPTATKINPGPPLQRCVVSGIGKGSADIRPCH